MLWQRVHLCTGILERDGQILLVANRYPNITGLLWNLPGGRQEPPETLAAALIREFVEETSLAIRVLDFAYVAESFDWATTTHVTNVAFHVAASGEPRVPPADAHVVDYRWVPASELTDVLRVAVVREPLVGYLADRTCRYFGYADAGISIEFAD